MAGNISDQTTVLSNLSLQGGLQLGGSRGVTVLSKQTFAVAAITCVATKSTTTDAVVTGLLPTDVVAVVPTASGYSNGVSLSVSASTGTLTLNFSNCSTVNVVQAAGTYTLSILR